MRKIRYLSLGIRARKILDEENLRCSHRTGSPKWEESKNFSYMMSKNFELG